MAVRDARSIYLAALAREDTKTCGKRDEDQLFSPRRPSLSWIQSKGRCEYMNTKLERVMKQTTEGEPGKSKKYSDSTSISYFFLVAFSADFVTKH